jgi:hypothetical protein
MKNKRLVRLIFSGVTAGILFHDEIFQRLAERFFHRKMGEKWGFLIGK